MPVFLAKLVKKGPANKNPYLELSETRKPTQNQIAPIKSFDTTQKAPTSQADLRRINTAKSRHKDKMLKSVPLLDQPEEQALGPAPCWRKRRIPDHHKTLSTTKGEKGTFKKQSHWAMK